MKLLAIQAVFVAIGCSSQEEHVLKPEVVDGVVLTKVLLLARGACIETGGETGWAIDVTSLLLARGACIETLRRSKARGAWMVAPRKRSMY